MTGLGRDMLTSDTQTSLVNPLAACLSPCNKVRTIKDIHVHIVSEVWDGWYRLVMLFSCLLLEEEGQHGSLCYDQNSSFETFYK